MRIFNEYLDRELSKLDQQGVRLYHIGSLFQVSAPIKSKIQLALKTTEGNSRLHLAVAFNYGGRADIVHAIQQILVDGMDVDCVDEATVTANLSTNAFPFPDLVIRTGGEHRLSNFLLWEAANSVFWVTPTLWPDFQMSHLLQALDYYSEICCSAA